MDVASGEYQVFDVMEDAEKDGLSLESAKVETEKPMVAIAAESGFSI